MQHPPVKTLLAYSSIQSEDTSPNQLSTPLIIPHIHSTILSFLVTCFLTTRLKNKFVAYLPIYTYKKAKSHGKAYQYQLQDTYLTLE